MKNKVCEDLLHNWCEKLLTLQITDKKEEGLYGGILCPACARVHGRCFDAVYPFLYMADVYQDLRFLNAAKLLFDWAEGVVSRPDGSYVNETDSDWKGITVFSAIQLAEALKYHGQILDRDTHSKWMERLSKAAEFLSSCEALNTNNINYRITNALAMQYSSELLGRPEYAVLAQKNVKAALDYLSPDGLLFGEGVPSGGRTARGCRAVDIGYNVEESLPALASYARMTGDQQAEDEAVRALSAQLLFMLPDGGWDNSFGTRNFKWTYWGSRTSDGSAFGYLLMADRNPAFAAAALRSLLLQQECTHDGLLHGGPHYHRIGERPCVHHTFTHAKVLANILDHGLSIPEDTPPLPRSLAEGVRHLADIDTYLINRRGMLATITASDWEYLPGGHASGGNLSLLWQPAAGPVLCASMSQYQMKEPGNMQLPRFEHHECLSPSLEYMEDGRRCTSLYDFGATMEYHPYPDGDSICVQGQLVDIRHDSPKQPMTHHTRYLFGDDQVTVEVWLNRPGAVYVCPIISEDGEPASFDGSRLTIMKKNAVVTLTAVRGSLSLPWGFDRCYNLTAGFQAIKAVITPADAELVLTLSISTH